MAAVLAPVRTLTEIDHARITKLLAARPDGLDAEALADLIATSDLVASPAVAPDVVTMYSQVTIADETSGARMTIALAYPADAEPTAGFISVLAPLGTAMLGLRVGDVARWTTPDGEQRAARILEMRFQPEASGDYTT
jgi:regulator of nucleoside diphosphate kinase